jgi:RecA/RadA recombinase|tara:strand:- start:2 stop:1090 length:1089 start_codon:yes stop_codon:yes gene_type:complete
MSNLVDKAFAKLQKLNSNATTLEKNTLSNVTEWIDTGCLVLNSILSGSLYGGVPKGRITIFAGDSGCGKTFILNKILAHAQQKGMVPVIFDTEVAVENEGAENVGLDTSNVKYVPVDTVESCRNQIMTFLDEVEKEPELHGKFIISIDSLGNLASEKEINDAGANKGAMDMGLRAKQLKSMMRIITYKAAVTGTTVIASNHTYADPGALHPTLVKQQAGGSGPVYMASILVQMAAKKEKTDAGNTNDEALTESRNYSGVTLRMLTVKNRFIPAFLQGEAYLNFKTGLEKYSGLKDIAVSHGIIQQNGSTYSMGEKKLGYYKNWRNDEETWSNVLPKLESSISEKYRYGKSLSELAILEQDDE